MENTTSFGSRLRNNIVAVPEAINTCSGIRVFGQLLKSFLFSTDVAIIRNTNANAIIAVYPFTPPAHHLSIIDSRCRQAHFFAVWAVD